MVLIVFKLQWDVIWGAFGLGLSPSPGRVQLKSYDHRFIHQVCAIFGITMELSPGSMCNHMTCHHMRAGFDFQMLALGYM